MAIPCLIAAVTAREIKRFARALQGDCKPSTPSFRPLTEAEACAYLGSELMEAITDHALNENIERRVQSN